MPKTKQLVFTALCTALGVVLPLAVHWFPNAGSVLLPMHLSVLLCGLVCDWRFGALCGAVTPVLSNLFTGMPPPPFLPSMVVELVVYGLAAGLLLRAVRTGNSLADLYISLIGAMLAGRIIFGALNSLVFRAGEYSLAIWVSGMFVTALPGIAIQLALLPALVLALRRAGAIAKV